MKRIKYTLIALTLVCGFALPSCEEFESANENPNSPEAVSSNYLLTYVLTKTATTVYRLGAEGSNIAGAMQYIQRGTNEGAWDANYYQWERESWNAYYDILRNTKIIYDNAVTEENNFFQGIALVMRAYVFGLLTDLYGDVPYSEALQAGDGAFFPKYDQQRDVYKGILEDLREASSLLSSLDANDQVDATSDVLYGGDAAKWRKLANSLRLRYALRLSLKRSEMSNAGIDIVQEFKEAAPGAFTGNGDNAILPFLGTSQESSTVGGPLNSSNPFYSAKPGQPFVDQLLNTNDPRLQRWIMPVLHKWDESVSSPEDRTITNIFGDTYTVKFMPAPSGEDVDTSLYVGLPIGLENLAALNYNKGNDTETYQPERSPYISFLHPRYRQDKDDLLGMDLMTYDEVEFILAEAALDGSFGVSGSAEQHYKAGIQASMDKWGVAGASGFDFDDYYSQPEVSLASASNKVERIMEQKWVASWLRIEFWFDWRRTGLPDLKTGPIAQYGPALPIRFMYPTPNLDPKYLVNYEEAVERLESTSFVPSGQSKDHPYSKMWLLQGTSKPW